MREKGPAGIRNRSSRELQSRCVLAKAEHQVEQNELLHTPKDQHRAQKHRFSYVFLQKPVLYTGLFSTGDIRIPAGLTLLVAALRPQLADLACDAAGTGARLHDFADFCSGSC